MDGKVIAERLRLRPLPDEGGLFRQTHLDEHSSAIYFMLLAPEFSAMHRLGSTEVYHWYSGAPLRMLLLDPDGAAREPLLGPDLAAGQQPQLIVPAGVWQGSSSTGEWTLVGSTMAPPFRWEEFQLGARAELRRGHPHAAARIAELTRS